MVTISEAKKLADKTTGVEVTGTIEYINKVFTNPKDGKTMQKITIQDDTGRIDVTLRGLPEMPASDKGKLIGISNGYMGTFKNYRTIMTSANYILDSETSSRQSPPSNANDAPVREAQPTLSQPGTLGGLYNDKEYWMEKNRKKDFFICLRYAVDVYIAGLITLESIPNLAFNWVRYGYEDVESEIKPVDCINGIPKKKEETQPIEDPVEAIRVGINSSTTLDDLKVYETRFINYNGQIPVAVTKEICDMIDARRKEIIKGKLK